MPNDLGFTGLESLKAVQTWISALNSNIQGSAKPGYKSLRLTFGSRDSLVVAPPSGGLLADQYPEPTFRVFVAAPDFSQGPIRPSGEKTHFAIKDRPNAPGVNFFVLRELDPATVGASRVNSPNYRFYFTRDGEFRWVEGGRNAITPDADDVLISPPGTLSGDYSPGYLLVNNYNLPVLDQNSDPLFVPSANFPPATIAPLVTTFKSPQNLVYSRYGSTIFNVDRPPGSSTDVSFTDNSQDAADPTVRFAERVQNALESANASVTALIPELTLAQKTFTALSKVLTVFSQDLDISFGHIRG